jgi:hypothetical protein
MSTAQAWLRASAIVLGSTGAYMGTVYLSGLLAGRWGYSVANVQETVGLLLVLPWIGSMAILGAREGDR